MQSLAELQRGFAAALLDPALPTPTGLVGPDGEPSSRRFAVYRNNVMVGLTQTLKDAYPAVHRIVGSEFFHALARAYVVGHLPRSPMLFDYGAGLADFIDRFEPASVLPYLAEVARIERAWIEAYHSAEATPIGAAAFSQIDPDLLPDVSLVLHPSARIVSSRFPALTIWRMNVEDGTPAQIDLCAGGEDALVLRPKVEVEVRSIPAGSADFIRALATGRSVLAAFEEALVTNPGFDLAANLTDLVQVGAVIGLGTAGESLKP
jgi:stage V sporulation protein SpoVS